MHIDRAMLLPKRIIVPTDFSSMSEAALDYALGVAKVFGGRVLLLHAFQPPAFDLPAGIIAGTADSTERILRSAEQALASAIELRKERGVSIEPLVTRGAPWRVISELAAGRKDTMIVMATHGRKDLPRALLGSVAEKVVRMANCPVLVVPAKSAEGR